MLSLKKILLFSFILINQQNPLYAMELSEKPFKTALSENDSDLLSAFLTNYRSRSFFSSRSTQDLEKIISISYDILDDPRELENISGYALPIIYSEILNEIIANATLELEKRNSNEAEIKNILPILKPSGGVTPKKEPPAPVLKSSGAKPKQIAPSGSKIALKKIIQAEIKGEIDYLSTRSNYTLEKAIELVNETLNNNAAFTALKKELGLPKEQLRSVLERIKQKASIALRLAQNKAQIPLQEKRIPEKILATAPIIPAIVKQEEPEEEVQANQLYIGLDVKEFNSNGQPIRWQDSIDAMQAQIKDADFVPNDYFHITIAWYEAKNPLTPEIIARVERALANASQILKIVFPQGVTGIALLDSAVLLGNKNATVAFRVAESADLKKLQDILLKFLSFENIGDFKFNTFEKDTPIHVTLGKIRSKSTRQYQNAAANLHAPEGARASQKQSFTINTFRLTYSLAGQAWQEKMSYKF